MNNIGIIIYLENDVKNCENIINAVNKHNIIVTNDCNGKSFPTTNTVTYYDKKFYAACVNDGMRYLSQHGCDHIFILRDNVVIDDISVFDQYVKTFEATGIHMLFNSNNHATVYDYDMGSISINDRFFKHFIYINKNCIKQIGYLDEKYKDSFEILDYYYRLYNKGLVGPYGYFASPFIKLVDEIKKGGNIDVDEDMILRGLKLFRIKFDYLPNAIPILNRNEAAEVYDKIYKKFVLNK